MGGGGGFLHCILLLYFEAEVSFILSLVHISYPGLVYQEKIIPVSLKGTNDNMCLYRDHYCVNLC
jgi:hypothetical protein